MSFRRERRALRYIERGDVLRLKSYIRKHHRLQLDKALPGGRSLLHVACSLPDNACALLLLRKGADPMQRDAAGNNALHIAAQEAEKRGWEVYTDLVVPILKRSPESIDVANQQGTTPRDILRRAEDLMDRNSGRIVHPQGGRHYSSECSEQWREKILAESMDEYQELYGNYEAPCSGPPIAGISSLCGGPEKGRLKQFPRGKSIPGIALPEERKRSLQWCLKETVQCSTLCPIEDYPEDVPEMESFESWADRIYREYQARKIQSEHPAAKSRKVSEMQKLSSITEEKTYLQRHKQKEMELREVQHERYQKRCEEVFGGACSSPRTGEESVKTKVKVAGRDSEGSSQGPTSIRTGLGTLSYRDIPWPLPGGTAEQMAQAIAAGGDSSDPGSFKRYLRAQRVTWHPDRFMQRCGTRLLAKDQERVLRTVTALSQELNRLAELTK